MENPSIEFQKKKDTPKQKKDESKIEIETIISAQKLIIDKSNMVVESELMYSPILSEKYSCKIYLKREDRQRGSRRFTQEEPSKSEGPTTST